MGPKNSLAGELRHVSQIRFYLGAIKAIPPEFPLRPKHSQFRLNFGP